MLITLIALAISTILNAVYFFRTVIRIYTPAVKAGVKESGFAKAKITDNPKKSIAMIIFIIINLLLGLSSETVIGLIEKGLSMFA